METLNTNRNFGQIAGEHHGARFEQDGEFFDSQGRKMEKDAKGIPILNDEAPPEPDEMSPQRLITQLESGGMHFFKFKAAAKRILGPDSPGDKQGLIDALRAIGKNIPPDSAAPKSLQKEPDAGDNAPNGVNLHAWGTGKANYRMAEVAKALREQHNYDMGSSPSMAAAVDFLIRENVITEQNAREV